MVKISDKNRELLGKLDCEDDFWICLDKQLLSEIDTNRDSDPYYWPRKAGFISARLRSLLAAIRAHEETE